MAKIAVIGAGFSGLSAAAYLSAAGHEVHVFEKNESAGGRARQLKTEQGYVFDMGPSWYWMPDVFERFFNDFGSKVSDWYNLKLLDPSFDVVFEKNEKISIPANYQQLKNLFERIEKGSADRLDKFMEEARHKYAAGMQNLVYMPGNSMTEFTQPNIIKEAFRLQIFSSFSRHVRHYFSNPKLVALMEFPVLFLGAMPQKTPALYSLMNYAGLKLGTWYPENGGFGKVVKSIQEICEKQGTTFHFNSPVEKILIEQNFVQGIIVNKIKMNFGAVIASADYNHVEEYLLPPEYKNYNERYWNKKTFAPSCLIFYIGVSRKINNIQHHTLFFEEELLTHSVEIYQSPAWPSKPLFYACCPSKSDDTVAPEGHENLFLLMPIAPGLEDDESLREKYFKIMLNRFQNHIGESIEEFIDFKKSYCISDFVADYHAYKGNAYGLANTLRQTAFLKPKIRNKKVNNLFYAGQLTVPGPGVPPALISGKIASEELLKYLKNKKHEILI
jgi:phytoene desaturase